MFDGTEPGPWTDPQTHLDTDPVNRPDADAHTGPDAEATQGEAEDEASPTVGDS